MTRPRPPASLSLDLDNRWSYLKTRGISTWEALPSYLDVVVPRVLEFLEARSLSLTVFVVGQDAALPASRGPLEAIAARGHEIGNHSFHHEPWLHLYSPTRIADEIARAEEAIGEATGKRPVGFRGPGYSLSEATLRALVKRGYLYDASTLPTFLGPLARAYYFFQSPLTRDDRSQRKALFGSLRDGLRPLRPYRWDLEGRSLVEIPVTTIPFLRMPFHPSYVLYLASFSPVLARLYFRTAIALCARVGIGPSLLLHPLDFLDGRDCPDLAFFPAMNLAWERKRELLDAMLRILRERFEPRPMRVHAEILAASPLPTMRPEAAALPGASTAEPV